MFIAQHVHLLLITLCNLTCQRKIDSSILHPYLLKKKGDFLNRKWWCPSAMWDRVRIIVWWPFVWHLGTDLIVPQKKKPLGTRSGCKIPTWGTSVRSRIDEFRVISAVQVPYPIGSMYAIYGNICHQYTPNVSIYHTWILWVLNIAGVLVSSCNGCHRSIA